MKIKDIITESVKSVIDGITVHDFSEYDDDMIFNMVNRGRGLINDGDVVFGPNGVGIMTDMGVYIISGSITSFRSLRTGLTWDQVWSGKYFPTVKKAIALFSKKINSHQNSNNK
jgi:hypothetical protein